MVKKVQRIAAENENLAGGAGEIADQSSEPPRRWARPGALQDRSPIKPIAAKDARDRRSLG